MATPANPSTENTTEYIQTQIQTHQIWPTSHTTPPAYPSTENTTEYIQTWTRTHRKKGLVQGAHLMMDWPWVQDSLPPSQTPLAKTPLPTYECTMVSFLPHPRRKTTRVLGLLQVSRCPCILYLLLIGQCSCPLYLLQTDRCLHPPILIYGQNRHLNPSEFTQGLISMISSSFLDSQDHRLRYEVKSHPFLLILKNLT